MGAAARRIRLSGVAVRATARRLGSVARVGIGYATGANDFFHLRPSVAAALEELPGGDAGSITGTRSPSAERTAANS